MNPLNIARRLPTISHSSPPRTTRRSSSKVLQALDEQMAPAASTTRPKQMTGPPTRIPKSKLQVIEDDGVGDDSVEIVGPIKNGLAPPKPRAKSRTPTHPFFIAGSSKTSVVTKIPCHTRNIVSGSSSSAHSAIGFGEPWPARTPDVQPDRHVRRKTPTAPIPIMIVEPEPIPPTIVAEPVAQLDLPIYSYKSSKPVPAVVYTRDEGEANDLVSSLKVGSPVGFDMEWRVDYRRKAPPRPTAVVQVCDDSVILIIQISKMRAFPQKLRELVESRDVVKMGANILNDGKRLFKDFGIKARNLVELGALAWHADSDPDAFLNKNGKRRMGGGVVALAKVVERYCGAILEKGEERTSNWELDLGPNMLDYAANDVHCALAVYKRLLAMAAEKDITLDPTTYTKHVGEEYTGLADSDQEEDDAETETTPTASGAPAAPRTTNANNATTKPQAPLGSISGRAQHVRAYRYWHDQGMELEEMCRKMPVMGTAPLKRSTVIAYIIGALAANPTLPFEMRKLRQLITLDSPSWTYHQQWLKDAEKAGRGMPAPSAQQAEV